MANSNDYIAALQSYHPDINLSDIFGNESLQAQNSGMNINDFVGKYVNDPRIIQAYTNKYTQFAQPQIAALQGQIGIAGQQQGLNNAQYGLTQSATQQQYGQNATNIQQGFRNDYGGFNNNLNSRGLSTTGAAVAGNQQLNNNFIQNMSFNDAQRANSLAALAIENQQSNLQAQANIGQLQGQIGSIQTNIGQQAQQDAYNNSQNFYNRQLSSLQAVSSPNLALLATSSAYAQAYGQLLSRAGLGSASVADIMASAKAAQNYATNGGSTSASAASSGGSTGTARPTATPSANTYGYSANNAGVSQQQYLAAVPGLIKIFNNPAAWQGKDQNVMSQLQKTGLNPSQASWVYYHARKQLINQ